MQNEPNLLNTKMNLNYYPTTNYNQKHLYGGLKNEPKRTQFQAVGIKRKKCFIDELGVLGIMSGQNEEPED